MKIAIAYVPVVHQGYLDFLKKVTPNVFYVLGEEFYSDFRPIEKDIRKLSPNIICNQLSVADTGVKDVQVLTKEKLIAVTSIISTEPALSSSTSLTVNSVERVEKSYSNSTRSLDHARDDYKKSDLEFFLPAEDISRLFAEKYLADQKVEFVDFFLRWDAEASLKQKKIKENYLADTESFESQMLGLAYTEAEKSSDFWRQVGAVIVKDKKIILHTYNTHNPTPNAPYFNGDPRGNFKKGIHIELSTALHAESGLIAAAAKQGVSLANTEMYVTTFPCPNCAKLIAHSGIKTLYFAEGYSMLDGEEIMKAEGVEIVQVGL